MVTPASDLFDEVIEIGWATAKSISNDFDALKEGVATKLEIQSVAELYVRTVSHFRAIMHLASKKAYHTECTSLLRPLVEDSIRLAALKEMDRPSRIDAIATWNIGGLNYAQGLMVHLAEEANVGTAKARKEASEEISIERAAWEAYRAKYGSGKKNSILSNNDMLEQKAFELDQGPGWWMHDMADQTLHGGLLSRAAARTTGAEGEMALEVGQYHPAALIDIVAHAVDLAVLAHFSTFEMLGVEVNEDQYRAAIDRVEQIQAKIRAVGKEPG